MQSAHGSTYPGDSYRIGQVVTVQVERVLPFGVFVRLPDGVQAYVRRRELTQAGDLDPRQVVSEGDEIQGVVIALADSGRNMELSVRRAESDPWEAFARSHRVRDTVTGMVKSLTAKVVFVQVLPGVDGLIPLEELAPWPVERPDELLWVGDQVEAMITRLDRRNKRLRLSIRQQMMHQVRVREVMEFIDKGERIEDEPLDVVDSGFIERSEQEVIGPLIAKQVGRILVVDDHDEVREPLVTWLCRQGLTADGVKSLKQALSYLQKRKYGLALVDLNLAGDDGIHFIQALAREAPDTRVMVMSTPEWIAQRSEELLTSRVVDAFVKPLDLEEIRHMLIRLGRGETPTPLWASTPRPDEGEAQTSFQRLTETMRSGLSLAARFEAGLKELVHSAQAEAGIVFHLDPDSQQVSIVVQVGRIPLNREAIYALNKSPVKDVIQEQHKVFERHVSLHAQSRFSNLRALLPFESCLGVPIFAEGKVEYALFLFHRQPEAFSRYRLRDAQAMAMLFSVALENQALERRIRELSPFLLSGHLAAGFGHEVYNKMSGLEIQLRNLRADGKRLAREAEERSPEPGRLTELNQAIEQLLGTALDLKETVELFRELLRAEQSERVDVNEVIRRAAQLLRPTARRHRMSIELDLASDLPPIIGSAVRLQQVFFNLMLNAVQHTARKMTQWLDGRGVLRVSTTWAAEEERPVQVRFADNGPGIHRQWWETIFALGFSSQPGGTGLGLFIARSLVESMGGQVVVERSVIPIGTTFRVELPGSVQEA